MANDMGHVLVSEVSCTTKNWQDSCQFLHAIKDAFPMNASWLKTVRCHTGLGTKAASLRLWFSPRDGSPPFLSCRAFAACSMSAKRPSNSPNRCPRICSVVALFGTLPTIFSALLAIIQFFLPLYCFCYYWKNSNAQKRNTLEVHLATT